ncbi:uncharacterized protein CC84DRAFT_1210740 [Paraphaeosphaeria sporulosa]|uniref:DUF7923 domain-containing protein n=1 Tax=Paraphaeosphaeria sporulosa TaxID=1460663 RepID=A0A177BVA8_9PLEO|nr:uncharacterized protein CC84DRAFT_1210740 [Paraphaeosphaeria sporulosa]OAF98661.1 hypothetical protein CC84DRAFT_1210740 [Paraphaeosphaeria sporulosa]
MLSDGSKGGPLAARLLREAVKEYLLRYLPDISNCRIMVQTFANLKQLSMDAAERGLLDNLSPSLGTFTSSFSSRVDCDFTVVQVKSVMQRKILNMCRIRSLESNAYLSLLAERLKECVKDPSCAQVFLAAARCTSVHGIPRGCR